jgi:eukaryotic-like serine/threonine-protein kinase
VSTRASGLSDAAVTRLRALGRWPEFESGRYSVTEEIGRGGMGTVFLAVDEELGREVAIKIPNALASADLERRLRREARVLASLEHPGIVPIHDAGRLADGRLFYVMKRVKGRTLAEHLQAVPDLTERLRIFERISEPVAFAHAQGFIHRDLKPENVMVGSFGEVMVMDWGVAKAVGSRQSAVVSHSRQSQSTVPVDSHSRQSQSTVPVDSHSRQSQSTVPVDSHSRQSQSTVPVDSHSLQSQSTVPVDSHSRQSQSTVPVDSQSPRSQSTVSIDGHSPQAPSTVPTAIPAQTSVGTVVGTVGFMAPEQARGEVGDVDERADVYGLGAILFLLLTNRIPDADLSRTLRLLQVPRPLAAICARALAVEPSSRYQSVTALAEDVARYRDNRKVDAYRETVFERAVRFGRTHRTAILLVLAYILMRAAVAFFAHW